MVVVSYSYQGLVAQWITRLTTDQKIAGSNPAWIENSFFPKSFQVLVELKSVQYRLIGIK